MDQHNNTLIANPDNLNVYIRIVDHDINTFGLQVTRNDVFAPPMLSYKILSTTGDGWKYGKHTHVWKYYYPDMESELSADDWATFQDAINNHTSSQPLLLQLNEDVGFGDRIPRNIETPLVYNRHGRRIVNYFRIDNSVQYVTTNSSYNKDLKFGTFIVGGPRCDYPMDHETIDLVNFDKEYQNGFVAVLVAKIYAAMFTETNSEHGLCKHVFGKTFPKLYRRQGNTRNVGNLVVAPTQSGKSKELLVNAVMNLFLGPDSIVLLRNVSGNQAKSNFRNDLRDLEHLIKSYAEDVLDVNMNDCDGLLASISLYNGDDAKKLERGHFKRPFIYCERTNPSKIELPFKTIYGNSGDDKYSLFIDEEDEQLQSLDGSLGSTEQALYTNLRTNLDGQTIFGKAHMTTGFTATPMPILTFNHNNGSDDQLRFNVIKMSFANNYKGHDPRLPADRRIVLVPCERKKHISRAQRMTMTPLQAIITMDQGIQKMLRDMQATYNDPEDDHPYLSGLIACSGVRLTISKHELAKGISIIVQGVPMVTFSHDQEVDVNIYYSNMDIDQDKEQDITTEIKDAFGGTRDRYKKKHIVFSILKNDVVNSCFNVTFKNKEDKTVQVLYDIAQIIFEQVQTKPFIVCTSFILANRAVTFKTSNHDLPLTHMYISTKSEACTYMVDIKQSAGRICGIDKYNFKRYLYATEKYFEMLALAYHTESDMLDTYIGDQLKTRDEALENIAGDTHLGKVTHHTPEKKILKRSANEDLIEIAKTKIPRLDRECYTNDGFQSFIPDDPSQAPTKQDESDNSVKIPHSWYQRLFMNDLQQAWEETRDCETREEMIDVWQRMELSCETRAPQGCGARITGVSNRKHWVAICLLLVSHDGYTISFKNLDKLQDFPSMRTSITLNVLTHRQRRDNGGNTWRSWSGGQHFRRYQDGYILAWL